MVVDKNGTIQCEYINPNYNQGISGEMLLSVLETLKNESYKFENFKINLCVNYRHSHYDRSNLVGAHDGHAQYIAARHAFWNAGSAHFCQLDHASHLEEWCDLTPI